MKIVLCSSLILQVFGCKQESSWAKTKHWTFKRGLTTKSHLCYPSAYPVMLRFSPCNFYDASKGKKLIESIYSKNNNYLLIDKAYEDDTILTLAEARGFCKFVSPKKNRKFHWFYDKQLYKQHNNIERYFLRLKRFKRVFTCYDKLYSILVFVISPAFICDLLFM